MIPAQYPDPGADLRAEALAAADAWCKGHHPLLEATVSEFVSSSSWPTAGRLAKCLGVPAATLARVWDRAPIGLLCSHGDGSAALLARAMAGLTAAEELLSDLVHAVQLAVRCLLAADGVPVLQSSLLRRRLELDQGRLLRLTQLLWSEPGLGGIRVGGLDWAWTLDDSILQFRAAASVDAFLAEQAWIIWPDGPVSPPMVRAVRHPEERDPRLALAAATL